MSETSPGRFSAITANLPEIGEKVWEIYKAQRKKEIQISL
jgi:hypothetical protein